MIRSPIPSRFNRLHSELRDRTTPEGRAALLGAVLGFLLGVMPTLAELAQR